MTEEIVREGNKAVVAPAGDIVALTAMELRPVLRGLVADGIRELVLDLRNVVMIDSSGLGLLIAAHNSLRRVGGVLSVIHASGEVLELFGSTRMHQHVRVSGMPRS